MRMTSCWREGDGGGVWHDEYYHPIHHSAQQAPTRKERNWEEEGLGREYRRFGER